MAENRVDLLLVLVLSGTLVLSLLGSVRGWERIDEKELLKRFQTGKWDDSLEETSPDPHAFFNEDDDEEEEEQVRITEDPDPEAEGVATSLAHFDPFEDHSLEEEEEEEEEKEVEDEDDSDPTEWAEATGSDFQPEGYSLKLQFVDDAGQTQVSTVSCEVDFHIQPRAGGKRRCCKSRKKPSRPSKPSTPPKAHNCAVSIGERVSCGYHLSSTECIKKGCCMDASTYGCYYPLDECTADQHFVFAIRATGSSVPVNPRRLVIPGHSNCKPVIVNNDVAIFKFKVNECGTRAYHVGEMKIYLAEVQTVVRASNLKYGIITRCDPLRFMIECRYTKCGPAKQSLASVGYMVKTPSSSLPSSILSNGLYGVQLRIARDSTYSKYLPTYHQPLKLLLGKPVYLELRLKSPKPDAVIIVNYCLAYPRSANNALVLVYEGCANPNDPNVAILKVADLPNNRHQRRLVVNAFQFMEQTTNKYLDEEIYFMCSTEVCKPREKMCKQRCFDGHMY
ncbi:zona pellucida sperm-binding protein 4-like [Gouania willdenowi]|uniref:zona pellucida sperm-binding protein 4-like n=1 Tax=Gouania willdenowi TaxID=441366 RepID=UPI001055EA57|nr:zona pellucida sperm-binding protein 4-like [Gouania willdenowi]